MKKLFYLICVCVITMMLFYSCESKLQETTSKNENRTYYIDTISIHGRDHEIIYSYYSKGGGFIHSPECWCGYSGIPYKRY